MSRGLRNVYKRKVEHVGKHLGNTNTRPIEEIIVGGGHGVAHGEDVLLQQER